MDNEYHEIKQHLLHVINLCAPTGEVQRAFVNLLNEAEEEGCEREEVIRRLLAHLYDGVAYGNWIGRNM